MRLSQDSTLGTPTDHINAGHYAAAAARLSKAFATIVAGLRTTETTMNADMTTSLCTDSPSKAKPQRCDEHYEP